MNPQDLADSAAPILEEGNHRRVHGAQSLESDWLKMVKIIIIVIIIIRMASRRK